MSTLQDFDRVLSATSKEDGDAWVNGGLVLVGRAAAKLTDDELWRAIAQNTETMSALLREQAELDDADSIAIHVLASRFQREYWQYVAELQRRYPLGGKTREAGQPATIRG